MAKLSYQETYLFCEQMAMILKSGMSLEDGLEAIISETEAGFFKDMLEKCLSKEKEHYSFYEAVSDLEYFNDYLVSMIDVGEKSGHLDDVMQECAVYYQRMDETHAKFKDALIYPSILLLMMLVVLGVIVIQVLPIFQQVLHNLGTSLSDMALGLMTLESLLAKYGFILLIIVLVLLMLIFLRLKVRYKYNAAIVFFAKFPLTKRLMEDMSVAQFAYAMSLLMSSGYDSSDAVGMVVGIVKHVKIKEMVSVSYERLKMVRLLKMRWYVMVFLRACIQECCISVLKPVMVTKRWQELLRNMKGRLVLP